MTTRLIRKPFPILTPGIRYQASSLGGPPKPPLFYQRHIYTAILGSKIAAESTQHMVSCTNSATLTEDQIQVIQKAHEKAEELFQAMLEIKRRIPLDTESGLLQNTFDTPSSTQSNNGFLQGYATAKTEDAVKEAVFNGTVTKPSPGEPIQVAAQETTLAQGVESVAAVSAEVSADIASGTLKAAGSLFAGVGEILENFFK